MPPHEFVKDNAPDDLPVFKIERLELTLTPHKWPFAEDRRAEIDAHFEALSGGNSALFNGRVLLMHQYTIDGAVLRGQYLETDFASFIAWRDWGFPDSAMRNCFALGALRGSDGGYILGVMGAHTSNAGLIYFPGGTPDPSDAFDGIVDLDASVRREVEEETGLAADAFSIAPDWTAVIAGPRIALIKIMQARLSTAELCDRISRHLAAEVTPELSGIHVVRGPADLSPKMPPFVAAFFRHIWSGKDPASVGCAASKRGDP